MEIVSAQAVFLAASFYPHSAILTLQTVFTVIQFRSCAADDPLKYAVVECFFIHRFYLHCFLHPYIRMSA